MQHLSILLQMAAAFCVLLALLWPAMSSFYNWFLYPVVIRSTITAVAAATTSLAISLLVSLNIYPVCYIYLYLTRLTFTTVGVQVPGVMYPILRLFCQPIAESLLSYISSLLRVSLPLHRIDEIVLNYLAADILSPSVDPKPPTFEDMMFMHFSVGVTLYILTTVAEQAFQLAWSPEYGIFWHDWLVLDVDISNMEESEVGAWASYQRRFLMQIAAGTFPGRLRVVTMGLFRKHMDVMIELGLPRRLGIVYKWLVVAALGVVSEGGFSLLYQYVFDNLEVMFVFVLEGWWLR